MLLEMINEKTAEEIEEFIACNTEGLLATLDPNWKTNPHLARTPDRTAKAWLQLMGGYFVDPKSLIVQFESDKIDQMVTVRNIEFYSTCAHHMVPFFGKAHVAYIPDGRVLGLSKIPRIVDVIARRLQIQEELTEEVAEILYTSELKPRGVAVVTEAQHLCMMARGCEKQHSDAVCTSLRGVFLEKEDTRLEFLSTIGIGK